MKIRFYKEEDNRRYADIPEYIESGGEHADLEMVSGADIMLDYLSNNGNNIILSIDTEHKESMVRLQLLEAGEYMGADYLANGRYGQFKVWLCSVTTYIFGEYPKNLYINKG